MCLCASFCCKRKQSCYLLLHSIVPCCTSVYFSFTPRRNYANRETELGWQTGGQAGPPERCRTRGSAVCWFGAQGGIPMCSANSPYYTWKRNWSFFMYLPCLAKCNLENHSYLLLWSIKYIYLYKVWEFPDLTVWVDFKQLLFNLLVSFCSFIFSWKWVYMRLKMLVG